MLKLHFFLPALLFALALAIGQAVSRKYSCNDLQDTRAIAHPIPRNLERLNRDLSSVLVLDFSKRQYPDHQENVLLLDKINW
jgi:hypothetical protein